MKGSIVNVLRHGNRSRALYWKTQTYAWLHLNQVCLPSAWYLAHPCSGSPSSTSISKSSEIILHLKVKWSRLVTMMNLECSSGTYSASRMIMRRECKPSSCTLSGKRQRSQWTHNFLRIGFGSTYWTKDSSMWLNGIGKEDRSQCSTWKNLSNKSATWKN